MHWDDVRGACIGAGIVLVAAAGAIVFTFSGLASNPLVRWLFFASVLLVLVGVAALFVSGSDADPDSRIGKTVDAVRAWFTT
ncbi:hypothetical protein ACIQUM_36295 [Amycolatopsis azurea]|uniref:hypothetical protein n=1 Tax=Amycolatopsis azurea TaxID=36819 RepID=UPI003807679E